MVERAQLPGPVATGEKRGSGRKTRSQKTPAETEAMMQFTPEGHAKMAASYGVAAVHVRIARNGTQDAMARRVLYHTARRLGEKSDWHMERAAELRRQHAEKSEP